MIKAFTKKNKLYEDITTCTQKVKIKVVFKQNDYENLYLLK